MLEIVIVILVIVVFIGLVYTIEHQAKTITPLNAGKSASGIRLLALVLGLVALGLSIFEFITSSTIEIKFTLIAVILLGYALGAGFLSKRQQGDASNNHAHVSEPPLPLIADEGTLLKTETLGTTLLTNRLVRFALKWAIIIALLAVAIYAAMWAAQHPDNPVTIFIVIGFILVFVAARLGGVFKILKK